MAGSGQVFGYFGETNGFVTSLSKSLLSLGTLGVNLFIIASGFGLTISRNHDKTNFFTFIKKRLFRIFPLYWGILLAILAIDLIMHHQVNYEDFIAHFFAIHNFFPQYVLSISAPFWFIGTILQLYVLFPFLYYLSKKKVILLVALALILKLFIDPQLVRLFGGGRFFTEYIIDFSIGIILGNLLLANQELFRSKKWLTLILPTAGLVVALLFCNLYKNSYLILPLIYQLLSLLLFIFLFSSAYFLNNKIIFIIKRLSVLTFTVFLTHYILITKIISKISFSVPFWLESIAFVIVSFLVAFLINSLIKFPKSFKNRSLS